MGYLSSGNQTVDAMGSLNITGNVIPTIWYKTILKENGKLYLLAIAILVLSITVILCSVEPVHGPDPGMEKEVFRGHPAAELPILCGSFWGIQENRESGNRQAGGTASGETGIQDNFPWGRAGIK